MSRIYTIKNSIGKLRQIESIQNSKEHEAKFVAEQKFYAKYRNISIISNYGTLSINELIIYNNGEENPIEINGYTFDPCIGYQEHYTANSNTYRQKFKLIGRTPDGEIFELEFTKCGPEILSYVIYAMVFTSYVGIKEANTYWDYLEGSSTHFLKIEEQIHCIQDLSNVAKRCIKDYPFMEYLYQEGFKQMKAEVVESFNSWSVLK